MPLDGLLGSKESCGDTLAFEGRPWSLIDKSGDVVEASGSGAVELSQIFEVYIGITHVQNEYTCT